MRPVELLAFCGRLCFKIIQFTTLVCNFSFNIALATLLGFVQLFLSHELLLPDLVLETSILLLQALKHVFVDSFLCLSTLDLLVTLALQLLHGLGKLVQVSEGLHLSSWLEIRDRHHSLR